MNIRESLGARMMVVLAALLLVVCAGLGAVAYFFAQDSVSAEVDQALELLSHSESERLRGLIDSRLGIMEEVAARDAVQSMDMETQLASLADDVERLDFMDLAIVDETGTARYVYSDPAELGDREYVIRAMEGESNISDILVSRVTGGLVVMFAVPVMVDGRPEAALIGRVDGTAIQSLVADMGFGDQGYAFVIGGDGTILAHPNRDLVMEQRSVFDPHTADLASMGEALAGMEAASGVIDYTMDGQERVVGMAPVTGTDWSLGIGAYREDVMQGVAQMGWAIGAASIVFLLLGIGAAWLIGRSVALPLTRATAAAEKLADGDLRLDDAATITQRQDEVGRLAAALQRVAEHLHSVIGVITEQVNTASESSQQLSASSEENSATVEEVASSVSEFANKLHDAAEHTQKMRSGAASMETMTAKSTEQMEQSRSSFEDIVDSSQQSKEQMQALAALTKDIESVIGLISDIAEQTNMLALNAAIEAARAGDSGRGFAVVAEEVRGLAEQTQESIGSIGSTMNELRNGVDRAVESINRNETVVQNGMASIESIGQLLQDTGSEIENEAQLIQRVSDSIEELEQGSQELSSAAEEQAASMAEVASAAESMSALARQLKEAAGHFKL